MDREQGVQNLLNFVAAWMTAISSHCSSLARHKIPDDSRTLNHSYIATSMQSMLKDFLKSLDY